MNYDWYSATVEAEADETLGYMCNAFPEASPEATRPLMGFGQAMVLKRGATEVAKVFWENRGRPDDKTCHVVGTGVHAAPVASALQSWQREQQVFHRVARVDVAEDFTGAGTWDRLSTMCLQVADEHRVKVEHAGDFHRALDGRTLYIGGRQSVVREVCYEKGKQLGADPDHVRLELRVRPDGRTAKYQAAQVPPLELYGASPWTRDLAGRLGHPDVRKLSLGSVYRPEDAHRSRRSMLRMYGNTLLGLKLEEGSWSAVGDWLRKELGD